MSWSTNFQKCSLYLPLSSEDTRALTCENFGRSFWDPADAKMRDEIDTRNCVVQAIEDGSGHDLGAPVI